MIGIQLVPIPQENNEISIEYLESYCKNENIKEYILYQIIIIQRHILCLIYLVKDSQNSKAI